MTLADTRHALGQYSQALALFDRAVAISDAAGAVPDRRALLQRRRATQLTELGRFDEGRAAVASARAFEASLTPAQRIGLALTAARLEDEAGQVEAAEAGFAACWPRPRGCRLRPSPRTNARISTKRSKPRAATSPPCCATAAASTKPKRWARRWSPNAAKNTANAIRGPSPAATSSP